jgi:hypothetical protein
VSNWWEYLTENFDFTSVWAMIRKATVSGKPFLHFLKSGPASTKRSSMKIYGIP